ncbi:DNA polymerase III subunit delta' [Corynebacterium godavarianum]|uniref:DNA polymerase III subunit delta n=1 Tax=Corynebacterium godavarianum TaxID=2054421 RepID=A0ABY3E5I3_9CORY|nr:DNA polymerase III subunit delta' [Corynebacterium godavarianum]MBL7284969.1 DNA polymerase III subunit delta' [Corynebacterium godavarianum]TSJ74828.1 DNA polymerase III subunit delta' [Corynebacterium godavarianum]
MTQPANPRSVAERLADAPHVRDVILSAAASAREQLLIDAPADQYAMTHSWLFTGPPGSGRSQAAMAFAAALVCTDPHEVGCGRCAGCRDALADQHADVVHVVPKELIIKTEYIRDIVAQAARMPTVAAHRVLIIENADRLHPAAADALLKTVEEPPERTVIIMLAPSTDPEDFSQTLRSRCRHLYIPSPSESELVRILMDEEGASEHDAHLAAATSLRHVGRARLLVRNPDIQQRRARAINLAELIFHGAQAFQAVGSLVKATEKEAVDAYAEEDAAERAKLEQALGMGAKGKGAAKALRGAASSIKELESRQKARGTRRKRDVFDLVLVDLAGVYRDALVVQSGADVPLTHPDFEPLAREVADRVPAAGLVACQDAIAQCRARLHQSVTPTVAFNGMIGHLRIACGVR